MKESLASLPVPGSFRRTLKNGPLLLKQKNSSQMEAGFILADMDGQLARPVISPIKYHKIFIYHHIRLHLSVCFYHTVITRINASTL